MRPACGGEQTSDGDHRELEMQGASNSNTLFDARLATHCHFDQADALVVSVLTRSYVLVICGAPNGLEIHSPYDCGWSGLIHIMVSHSCYAPHRTPPRSSKYLCHPNVGTLCLVCSTLHPLPCYHPGMPAPFLTSRSILPTGFHIPS